MDKTTVYIWTAAEASGTAEDSWIFKVDTHLVEAFLDTVAAGKGLLKMSSETSTTYFPIQNIQAIQIMNPTAK